MTAAIRVEHLSKQYILRHQRRGYTSLREEISKNVSSLLRGQLAFNSNREKFWALKDISFEINQGDAVGIIGRNGAGKSTLLKLLSRITRPTEGRIEIEGRVASLLEVGTGFHQELTGRENIYLNGAILGLSRQEIKKRFDEIVAFAEVEKFLDTPVKRYSSGMFMRLAFAVAAHLDPDILIVDEVLAVGDVEFQEKCLQKMNGTVKSGRTVLFVSHNMNAVQNLCTRAMLLSKGGLMSQGSPDAVIRDYLKTATQGTEWKNTSNAGQNPDLKTNPYFIPTRFALVNSKYETITTDMGANEQVGVLIEGVAEILDPGLVLGFRVSSENNIVLFRSLHTDTARSDWPPIRKGNNVLVCWLPQRFLNEGQYRFELIVTVRSHYWYSEPGLDAPIVELAIRGGLSDSPYWLEARDGLLAPVLPFHTAPATASSSG
jgi:lipopolysaccharide transport system ATP-binding protein